LEIVRNVDAVPLLPLFGRSEQKGKERDTRAGAYDPIDEEGWPQPDQVREKRTAQQDAQWGAEVRSEAQPGKEPVMPEGIRRERKGPIDKNLGRRNE
jgi:hypothetical protein